MSKKTVYLPQPNEKTEKEINKIVSAYISETSILKMHQPITLTRFSVDAQFGISASSVGFADSTGLKLENYPQYMQYYNRTHSLHSHDFFELDLIISPCRMVIEQGIYSFNPGELVLMNRNIRHKEIYEPGLSAASLQLENSFFFSIFSSGLEIFPEENSSITTFFADNIAKEPMHMKDYMIFQPISGITVVEDIFNEIEEELRQNQRNSKIIVYGLIAKLFRLLNDPKKYKFSHINLGYFPELKIAETVKHLIEKSEGKIRRKDLEKALNYTGDYINSIFKKMTGYSIKKYCQIVQMEALRDKIISSTESISSILKDMGFTNKTQTYKVFFELFHCTPQELRNHIQEQKN